MLLIIILDKVLGITLKKSETVNNLIVFISHESIKQFSCPVSSVG